MQRHTESCTKRQREEDVVEQDTNRTREENVNNQAPNEDEPSSSTKTCFGGTLQTRFGNIVVLMIYCWRWRITRENA